MSDGQSFIGDAIAAAVMRDVKANGKLVQALMRNERKGHAEPTTTDAEWEALRAHRQREFDAWQRLTQKLLQGGVLDTDEWGEHVLNVNRPTRWVHDEPEDEWHARVGVIIGQTVTFPIAEQRSA